MEMIKNVLNRVQEEIKKLKSIEKELLTDLNKKPRKIGIPFLEEVEEKRGVRILKEVNITKGRKFT